MTYFLKYKFIFDGMWSEDLPWLDFAINNFYNLDIILC